MTEAIKVQKLPKVTKQSIGLLELISRLAPNAIILLGEKDQSIIGVDYLPKDLPNVYRDVYGFLVTKLQQNDYSLDKLAHYLGYTDETAGQYQSHGSVLLMSALMTPGQFPGEQVLKELTYKFNGITVANYLDQL